MCKITQIEKMKTGLLFLQAVKSIHSRNVILNGKSLVDL